MTTPTPAHSPLPWLLKQLDRAERSLRSREQMSEILRTGTNAFWDAAAKIHPSTAKLPPSKRSDRLRRAATEERIAAQYRADIEMLRLLIHRVNAHAGLVEALEEARLQIEYLHDKFQTTSTGVATLAKIEAALAQAKEEA